MLALFPRWRNSAICAPINEAPQTDRVRIIFWADLNRNSWDRHLATVEAARHLPD